MLRLTLSGRLLLALIVVLQLASITSQSGLLVWLTGLFAGCLIVNALAATATLRGVRVQTPARLLVEEGSASTEPWRIVNEGKVAARLLKVELSGTPCLRLPSAPVGATTTSPPQTIFSRRGVYDLADLVSSTTFPFGLVKATRPSGPAGEVLVFPKLPAAPPPEVRGLEPMVGGRHSGKGRVASGAHFAGVRPATAGDSFRQIHWRSSAKGRGLMVKTFEEELGGRASIVLACEAGARAEEQLRAAGAMAVAGLEAGHQIQWIDAATGRRLELQPFADETLLLEELARFQFPARVPDIRAGSLPARGAVHIFASAESARLRAANEELFQSGRAVRLHLPNHP